MFTLTEGLWFLPSIVMCLHVTFDNLGFAQFCWGSEKLASWMLFLGFLCLATLILGYFILTLSCKYARENDSGFPRSRKSNKPALRAEIVFWLRLELHRRAKLFKMTMHCNSQSALHSVIEVIWKGHHLKWSSHNFLVCFMLRGGWM